MKSKVVILLLIVCIISSGFLRFFIYAGFQLNQKYIAANLCINKDKPWLHCNGKCYFMKKIKQAHEKEKSEESQSQKNRIQETFFEIACDFKFHNILLQIVNTPYRVSDQSVISNSFFRPPQLG